jgi:succinyl-CoA synthetase beta subunit
MLTLCFTPAHTAPPLAPRQVFHAIKILSADPTVRAIFVNIFGGIMRCDVVAAVRL